MLAMTDEADCRPYSQKLQRNWKRDFTPSRTQEWLVSARPEKSKSKVERILREVGLTSRVAKRIDTARSFPHIEHAITESESMLSLPEGWDDDAAQRIAKDTWSSATGLLRDIATSIYRSTGVSLPAPSLGPCADGSIDLFWKTASFKLLINVKPNVAETDFYGETSVGHVVKGPIDLNRPTQLLELLVRQ